uniref:EP300-interacting inhibitor of differentiation 2B n=1 Tax=Jaculus jaculus TaxID=51337 RepID=UPI000332EC02|nr:EP300-interacting inhibitor of differentiation 2B [Jaculus jaculus]
MSELPGESGPRSLGTVAGVSDELPAGVGGGGSRGAPEVQGGSPAAAARPMTRALGVAPRRVPGLMMAVPNVHLYEMHRHRLFHQYLDNTPMIPVRLLREVEERRKLFVEGCKAREAAFDANPPPMASDAAQAFTVALAAARGPLAD